MEVGDRREWERVAFGRDATPEEREEALAKLAAADAAVAAHSALAEETAAVDALTSMPRPAGSGRRTFVLGGSLVVLAAIAMAWATAPMWMTPRVIPPRGVDEAPITAADLPPGVSIDPISIGPGVAESLSGDGVLVGVQDLGASDRAHAYGALYGDGRYCVYLREAETASIQCATREEFGSSGVGVDRGYWGVTWFPDGTTRWDG